MFDIYLTTRAPACCETHTHTHTQFAILCHIVFFPQSIEKSVVIGKEVHYHIIPTHTTQTRHAYSIYANTRVSWHGI